MTIPYGVMSFRSSYSAVALLTAIPARIFTSV